MSSANSSHMILITPCLCRWLSAWLCVPYDTSCGWQGCSSCPHYIHDTGFGCYSSQPSWTTNIGLSSTEASCTPVLAIKMIWTRAREEDKGIAAFSCIFPGLCSVQPAAQVKSFCCWKQSISADLWKFPVPKTIAEESSILMSCLHIWTVSGLLFIYSGIMGAVNYNNLFA